MHAVTLKEPPVTDTPTPDALAEQILSDLRARANPDNVEGMARFGISSENTLGVSVPVMRAMARDARKTLGRDKLAWNRLAELLWETGVHDARLMTAFVGVGALVTEEQMDAWVAHFDSWDVCDQVCINLFRESPHAWGKMAEWAAREEEFVRRAAFALGATIAVHDKKRDDADFLPLLALAERAASDERNFVKKAVNWQIRQIGKRSAMLNEAAVATCERILRDNPASKAASWTARDALRELQSETIRARLGLG